MIEELFNRESGESEVTMGRLNTKKYPAKGLASTKGAFDKEGKKDKKFDGTKKGKKKA